MAYAGDNTFRVASNDELNGAIAALDAIGRGGGLGAGAYTISLTADITLGTSAAAAAGGRYTDYDGAALSINGAPVAGSNQLYGLNLGAGVSVGIDGSNPAGGTFTLNGADTFNGFFVYDGTVSISNLTLANTVARGGDSDIGGGGAGLGGGVFVAGPNPTAVGATTGTTGGNVTLNNVAFVGNAARGAMLR